MPLFTLSAGGKDKSMIRCYFPDCPLGITPKRLVWCSSAVNAEGKGPHMRPISSSLRRYSSITSGWSWADAMFADAEWSRLVRLNPIWKPLLKPRKMYRVNALSGWDRKASSHAGNTGGIDTEPRPCSGRDTGGQQSSRQIRSAVGTATSTL